VLALQALYEIDGSGHDPESVVAQRIQDMSQPRAVESFARKIIRGVLENLEQIDRIILTHAPAWPVRQLAAVDRNLLRVAIYELAIDGDTPPKVAINEAVEMGKTFGSDTSFRFVNGVLGSVLAERQASGEADMNGKTMEVVDGNGS
jgi:N utilization substance protein B